MSVRHGELRRRPRRAHAAALGATWIAATTGGASAIKSVAEFAARNEELYERLRRQPVSRSGPNECALQKRTITN